eukprot:13281160-Alexandrium_andersonii.AAC.1
MSASLVGSEMCIRDRLRANQPPSQRQSRDRLRDGDDGFRDGYDGFRDGYCLLYTSDAADDM